MHTQMCHILYFLCEGTCIYLATVAMAQNDCRNRLKINSLLDQISDF